MSGRKPKEESRATEFRQRLMAWKQTPESMRPSLRALGREVGTSHQLLQHYLDGLEIWHAREELARRARECQRITENLRAQTKVRGLTLGLTGNSAKRARIEGMGTYETAMENLDKAMMHWRRPRPWRSSHEREIIRRLAFWWYTARDERPSARAWARSLVISHTWMRKRI